MYRLIIFIFLLSASPTCAQELIWENTIGGDDVEWAFHGFVNSRGNYVISGYSYSDISGDRSVPSKGSSDGWVLELDPQGAIVRQFAYGGNFSDAIVKTLEQEDGSYIFAAQSYSDISGDKTEPSRGDRDVWIVDLDAAGNVEWERTYGTDSGEDITDFIHTSDGGYVVLSEVNSGITGDKTDPLLGHSDLWLLKLDAAGNLEWQKSYGGNGYDSSGKILETENGYLIAATSDSPPSGNKTIPPQGRSDYWLFEIDRTGTIIWEKSIGGLQEEHFSDLISASDGGFLLSGVSFSEVGGVKTVPQKSLDDIWVVKVSVLGDIQWQNSYAGNSTEFQQDLAPAQDGGYWLAAMSYSDQGLDKSEPSRGDLDFWILKITQTGELCTQKTLGGTEADHPWSIFEDAEGNIVTVGWTDSGASGDKTEASMGERDIWVTKMAAPEFINPVVTDPGIITSCEKDGDGFTEFNLLQLGEEIVGNQENIAVSFFDQEGIPLPAPLDAFVNTVKEEQWITARLTDTGQLCSVTILEVKLEVIDCGGGGNEQSLNPDFPQFFTPNGDGYHDTWQPNSQTREKVEVIYIFDRYGRLLKELGKGIGWDGKANGRSMPSDDYWFLVEMNDNSNYRGHFSLLRK